MRPLILLLPAIAAPALAAPLDVDSGSHGLAPGESLDWAFIRGEAELDITGGTITGEELLFIDDVGIGFYGLAGVGNAQITMSGGSVWRETLLAQSASMTVTGGEFLGDIFVRDNSSLTLVTDSVATEVHARGSASVGVNGGTLTRQFSIIESATLTTTDALFDDVVRLHGESRLDALDSRFRNSIELFDSAAATLNGDRSAPGNTGNIIATNESTFTANDTPLHDVVARQNAVLNLTRVNAHDLTLQDDAVATLVDVRWDSLVIDNASAVISRTDGNTVFAGASLRSAANVEFNSVKLREIFASDTSQLTLRDTSPLSVILSDASTALIEGDIRDLLHIDVDGASHATLRNASGRSYRVPGSSIRALDQGSLTIVDSAVFAPLLLSGESQTDVDASSLGRLYASGDASATIAGSSLVAVNAANRSEIALAMTTVRDHVELKDLALVTVHAEGFMYDHDNDNGTALVEFDFAGDDSLTLTRDSLVRGIQGDLWLSDLTLIWSGETQSTFDVFITESWTGSLTLVIPAPSAAAPLLGAGVLASRRQRG